MEQTEIISRPGANHDELRELWTPFIHTHHYEIHESFHDSWIANHPRRTLEAYANQYLEAKFIENTPPPPCRLISPPSRIYWHGSSRCSRPSAATWMR
jgi:hypothetical protein